MAKPTPNPGTNHRTETPPFRHESCGIRRLRPYPDNPRRSNVPAIRKSLELLGQFRPIVVNERTMEVLAGNHVVEAAKELGWDELGVVLVDADEETARRIVLADNRTSDLAGYDSEGLAKLLQELDELTGTGYEQGDVDALLDELEPKLELREDDPPPPPTEPSTKPGDLYEFGGHRLLCGDARDPGSYKRLLGDEAVELLWTDPPYGVGYVGKTPAALTIENDERTGLEKLLARSFSAIDEVLAEGARLYLAHPTGELGLLFGKSFLAAGWRLRQTLVWVKDSLVLGRSDYHYRHESILYGHKPGRGRIGRGGDGWYGDDKQTSVFETPRPRAARQHPTMKPPELVEACLRNSSQRSDLVLDPFAGSGSTLIACERLGRRAALIELDPAYCDVIVERFERLTGKTVGKEGV
jgi:DNA modification methylase